MQIQFDSAAEPPEFAEDRPLRTVAQNRLEVLVQEIEIPECRFRVWTVERADCQIQGPAQPLEPGREVRPDAGAASDKDGRFGQGRRIVPGGAPLSMRLAMRRSG